MRHPAGFAGDPDSRGQPSNNRFKEMLDSADALAEIRTARERS